MTSLLVRIAFLAALVGACDDQSVAPVEDPPRAMKAMVLHAGTMQRERILSGLVEAETASDIAFEVPGTIASLSVAVGDEVAKGEVIGRLDPERYKLKVTASQGRLMSAEASLADATKKFQQKSDLYKDGFATKSDFDSARANLDGATSAVQVSRSELDIALRDLDKTAIIAPFAGVIAERFVDVFENVPGGASIYTVQTGKRFKVEVAMPEALVNEVRIEDTVSIVFPGFEDTVATGKIAEISSQAYGAGAFPVTISLAVTPAGLKAGMSARVTFNIGSAEGEGDNFLVPTSSVIPGNDLASARVFVFDVKESVVRARTVNVIDARGENLLIAGEISEGDTIAIAGVSFLADEMRVRLLSPNHSRGE